MPEVASYQPTPPYFLIKIGKEEQRDAKEKIGSLYFPTQYAYMRRELQFGEIIAIGEDASRYMPMAQVGDYLLVHHFVSGKRTEKGHNFYLIDDDDHFNYYAVNAFEIPGEMPLAYAIAKGSEIIPTPDYIFLEVPKEDAEEPATGTDMMKVSKSGIIVPKERTKTREEWMEIMKKNMDRIKQLSRNLPHGVMEEIMTRENPERREKHEYALSEIRKLEAINTKISKDINKKKYEPFVVAAMNPFWKQYIESIDGELNPGDTVYMLNIACKTTMNFSGTEFIVAQSKFYGCSENYINNAIRKHSGSERHNSSTEKASNTI